MSSKGHIFGAVEAGGSKFVCAVGNAAGDILLEQRLPTSDPTTTFAAVRAFLRRGCEEFGTYAAIGIASFGPVEIDPASARYGHIGKTPKAGWSGTDILGRLTQDYACPSGFDSDVAAAALAEHRWGAARGVDNLVYLTVGTGIGGGVVANGRPIRGLMHPEVGHIYPRRHPLDPGFAGICPFHGDCLEGLASGPAIIARTGASLEQLEHGHPQWQIEADYLGQLCAQLVLTLSPQRIVMGGGVMSPAHLLPLVAERMQHWLGGYVDRDEVLGGGRSYLTAPKLGARAGVVGALVLAMDAAAAAD